MSWIITAISGLGAAGVVTYVFVKLSRLTNRAIDATTRYHEVQRKLDAAERRNQQLMRELVSLEQAYNNERQTANTARKTIRRLSEALAARGGAPDLVTIARDELRDLQKRRTTAQNEDR